MMAYVGTQGYIVNCELRPGVQHSQKGMDKFLPQTIECVESLRIDNPLYIMDSAHDASENINLFHEKGSNFLIKRNLRKEQLEWWLSIGRRVGDVTEPRPGKKVFTGIVSHLKPTGIISDKPIFVVFEVIERTIDNKGQELLIPDIEVSTW